MRIKLTKYYILFGVIWMALGLFSCSPTRYVPKGAYLLQDKPSLSSQKKIPPEILEEAIRTKANNRMLYPKTFLFVYNAGKNLEKNKSWFKKNLLKVPYFQSYYKKSLKWMTEDFGESPVLLDLNELRGDTANLRNACFAQGYFYPKISFKIDTLNKWYNKRQAVVTFTVEEGAPYQIRQVHFPDTALPNNYLQIYNPLSSHLQAGSNYNHQNFIKERSRITEMMRNSGYYTFTQKMVEFEVDTLLTVNEDAIEDDHGRMLDVDILVTEIPPIYSIRSIKVNIQSSSESNGLDYQFTQRLRASELTDSLRTALGISQKKLADSIDITYIVDRILLKRLNYNFISKRIHLKEGTVFSQEQARKTQQRLQELGMFRYVVINYRKDDPAKALDVNVSLKMAPHYQTKWGAETFQNDILTATNLPSVGANFSLRNRNTFRKSELLDMTLHGNIGFYRSDETVGEFEQIFYEYGADLSLNFPWFALPVGIKRDLSLYSPSTKMTGSYVQEVRQEFDRTRVAFRMDYRWNHRPFSDRAVSVFTPIAVNFNSTTDIDSAFQTRIDNLPPSIQQDFARRVGSRLNYNFTLQNYRKNRLKPSYWLNFNVEWGGNLPFILDNINALNPEGNQRNDNFVFDSLYYGQYIKASVEARYSIPLGTKDELVFRGYIGGAVPFNNTVTVPREARFFSGGTNSMRGWQSNTLGPGRTSLEDFQTTDDLQNARGLSLIAPGGEWIFELNAEYRLKLGSYLEMAFFTDLGNVWFHDSEEVKKQIDEKAVLNLANFRPGWDAGIGFRFDFSFLILRIDIGQQLFAPDLDRGWVIGNPEVQSRRTQLNLGIGYPF